MTSSPTNTADAELARLRAEPPFTHLPAGERARFEAMMPALLETARESREPSATLRTALELALRLFTAASPEGRDRLGDAAVSARLVRLIGASPIMGELLLARPTLVDELGASAGALDRNSLRLALRERLAAAPADEASRMRALRVFKQGVLLRVLAHDLEGGLDLDQVSRALSDLADTLLETVLAEVSDRQGLGAISPVGIVAYGKLGSREMSYASDTDIVFLHEDAPPTAEPSYTRLARTVNHWLSTATDAGTLYETDFRLRPYGAHGLFTSSLSAFREYQEQSAWTWEHQALTRARWIAGDVALGHRFAQLRRQVLQRSRNPDRLRGDVLAMRDRMLLEHRNKATRAGGPTATGFDVKHSRGGVIDVEFAVQHLILAHAPAQPELLDVGDNASALAVAARLGLVPRALADGAIAAFRAYRSWMHRERLSGNEIVTASEALAAPHRNAVLTLWQHVFFASSVGERPTGPLSENSGVKKDA